MKKLLTKIINKARTVYSDMTSPDAGIIRKQLDEFKNAPDEMLSSKVEAKTSIANLIEQFENLGVNIVREKIDIADFKVWMDKFPELDNFYENSGDVKIEKILEHYLTTKYLNLSNGDVYIDIAACSSPFAEAIRKQGITAYEQDLINPTGINGYKIGGDASSMPVSDNFADVLSMQCSFECFQGNSDVGFIKESGRVLKNGGRLGIIPLYIDNEYFVKTGPKCNKLKVSVEKGAKWIWRDDSWSAEPFSRHYSPTSFKNRVYDNLVGMNGEIFYFTNLDEVMQVFENQRVYCHFMFRASKK